MGYKEKWIVSFLEKSYTVGDNIFYDSLGNMVWGTDVLDITKSVFGFENEVIFSTIQTWGEKNGITDWQKARGRVLNYMSESMHNFGIEAEEASRVIRRLQQTIREANANVTVTELLDRFPSNAETTNHTWEDFIQPRGQDQQTSNSSWLEENGYNYIP